MNGAGLPLRNAGKRRVPYVEAGRMWHVNTTAVPQISIKAVTATPEPEYGTKDINSSRTISVRCDFLTAGNDAVYSGKSHLLPNYTLLYSRLH
jgi:hypothetical protein